MENVNSNFRVFEIGFGGQAHPEEPMWSLQIRDETSGRWHMAPLSLYLRDFDDLISVLKAEQSRVRND